MTVRRLADESLQPDRFAFSKANAAWAEATISRYPSGRQQSAVIPLLMRAQDQDGWVTRQAIEAVAEMLAMPYIRVLEVATFYTQFQLAPVGSRAHVQICGTTPCMLRGAEDLRSVCERRIHPDAHHRNAAGTLSWEEVECLGACVNAPMVMIGADTYEDLTVERFEEILTAFEEGHGDSIPPGPQIARQFSAPPNGFTSLTEPPTAERVRMATPPPPPPPAAPPAAAPAAQAAAPTAAPGAAGTTTTDAMTKPGRMREVSSEAAPAVKGPAPQAKVSELEAEAARAEFAKRAGDGEPNKAMRPRATGAEAKASKIDGGKRTGKATRSGPGQGSDSAGATPIAPAAPEGVQVPSPATGESKPTLERGGQMPPEGKPEGIPGSDGPTIDTPRKDGA